MQLGAGLIDLLYSGKKENMRLLGVLFGGLSLDSKNLKIWNEIYRRVGPYGGDMFNWVNLNVNLFVAAETTSL